MFQMGELSIQVCSKFIQQMAENGSSELFSITNVIITDYILSLLNKDRTRLLTAVSLYFNVNE